MREQYSQKWIGYAVAVLSVAAGLMLIESLRSLGNPGVFAVFLGTVVLSAWYGGVGPGLVALVCSTACGILLLSPHSHPPDVALRAGVFVAIALPILVLIIEPSNRRPVTSNASSTKLHWSSEEGRLLRIVTDELRGSLDPLILVSEMLRRQAFVPDSVREDLRTIREKVDLESRLLDDLSELAEANSGRLSFRKVRLNLREPLAQAVQACEGELREKQVELQVEFADTNSYVLGDAERLEQLFWNLIRSALRFAPFGGTMRMRTFSDPDDRIRVDLSDECVELDPAQVAAIFCSPDIADDRLAARFGSLGLGLAVSQTLTEAHGGSMWAEGLPGGTSATFHVSLPNAPAQSGHDDSQSVGDLPAMNCS